MAILCHIEPSDMPPAKGGIWSRFKVLWDDVELRLDLSASMVRDNGQPVKFLHIVAAPWFHYGIGWWSYDNHMGPNLGPVLGWVSSTKIQGHFFGNAKSLDVFWWSEVRASEVEKPPGCGGWEVEKQPCGLWKMLTLWYRYIVIIWRMVDIPYIAYIFIRYYIYNIPFKLKMLEGKELKHVNPKSSWRCRIVKTL